MITFDSLHGSLILAFHHLLLVEQTNLYVQQKHATSYKCECLTVPELKAFFGVLIYMEIIRKPATRNCLTQGGS